MSCIQKLIFRATAALLVAGLVAGPSWAKDKDKVKVKGKDKHEQHDDRDDAGRGKGKRVEHFNDQHRVAVSGYYDEGYQKSRRCPPGLAKKHNGCMPPGQAKKWQMGRPLPRDVVYYEVPRPLVVQIGTPPQGYRYVRVAGDILMIAIGTSIVVDAINNLGR